MNSSPRAANVFWFVWDGDKGAVLGRNDRGVVEVTPRLRDSDTFIVRLLISTEQPGGVTTEEPGEIIDFFWAARNRGFIRPLILPAGAAGVEVSLAAGDHLRPLARYLLDDEYRSEDGNCDFIIIQTPQEIASDEQSVFVRNAPGSLSTANSRLDRLHSIATRNLVWVAAASYEDDVEELVPQRRIAPLTRIFPRIRELIKLRARAYREETVEHGESDSADERRGPEPSIFEAAREPRRLIVLDIEAPIGEAPGDGVPGIVVYHVMSQRELIKQWNSTAPIPRFTVSDLEDLDGHTHSFARDNTTYVVLPLNLRHDDAQGLAIRAQQKLTANGLVRSFAVTFTFATLGDYLIVHDALATRLADEAGKSCRYVIFRVGANELENLGDSALMEDHLIEAAQTVVEQSHVASSNPQADSDPIQKLLEFIRRHTSSRGLHPADLEAKPLMPLAAVSYAAHIRQTPAVAERIDFEHYQRDPGVLSAAFLLPLVAERALSTASRRSLREPTFAERLAAHLGVAGLMTSPVTFEAELRAIDLLTDESYRELWEHASSVGVRVDVNNANSERLAALLKDLQSWLKDETVHDQLMNDDRELSHRYESFMRVEGRYQRPIATADFIELFELIQPVARAVQEAAPIRNVSAGPGPQLSPDARTNKQMHEDIMHLNAEIMARGDSQQQNIAARLLEELSHLSQGRQQPLRKHLREVENQLKDMLGLPAISNKVIALIDAMEEWAAVVPSGAPAARDLADRRERVVGLTRASRQQQQISGLSPHSQLGSRIGRLIQEVQDECQRLKEGAAVEDLETLTWLPDYARVLGFHVAYRKILDARAAGQGVPGSATRSLALWPERAADCWDKHFDWARKSGLQEHFTAHWHPGFGTRPVATSRNE